MSIGGSKGKGSSAPVFKTFAGSYGSTTPTTTTPGKWIDVPGEFGQAPSRRWQEGVTTGGEASYEDSKRLSQQAEGMIGQKSAFSTPLEQMLLNPQFGAGNQNQTNLINSLLDATAGRTATRGLGAPTEGLMGSAIAPTLVDFRNSEIQNLLGGQGAWQQGQNTTLQALMEMIGYAMPQVMGGQSSTERSGGFGISLGSGSPSGSSSGGKG